MKKSEMAPLEAAEIILNPYGHGTSERNKAECMAASCLRAIAAGEYKQVVHAHWEQKDCSKWPVCSNCGKPTLSCGYCPVRSNYCPSCGALMDGKDDNHA